MIPWVRLLSRPALPWRARMCLARPRLVAGEQMKTLLQSPRRHAGQSLPLLQRVCEVVLVVPKEIASGPSVKRAYMLHRRFVRRRCPVQFIGPRTHPATQTKKTRSFICKATSTSRVIRRSNMSILFEKYCLTHPGRSLFAGQASHDTMRGATLPVDLHLLIFLHRGQTLGTRPQVTTFSGMPTCPQSLMEGWLIDRGYTAVRCRIPA